jgi:serine/threonine protein kinase
MPAVGRDASEEGSVPAGDRFSTGDEIVPGLHAWALLGVGRRCETWLAWSTELWTQVVVKLPVIDQLGDARTAVRLGEEAAVLRRLSHPSIERLLADRHMDDVPHLVLEYAEGPTLDQLVDDEGPLGPVDAIRLGMQIACGLHHLHSRGIVHLDLKPANIILRDGRAVILDLDIARAVGEPAPPGRAHGTGPYMSPEQCRRGRARPQTDVYALGAVLYEIVTGVRAFPTRRADDGASSRKLSRRPRRLLAVRPDIPPELDAVIAELLEPDARRRPASAVAVLRLLRGALPPGTDALWPEWADDLLLHG